MSLINLIIIIFILRLDINVETKPKLSYRKDISEHCKRKVVPSVFLGRQVVEANAKLLQLSRLELPYSCFITIRTESGSNVIMVLKIHNQNNIESYCSNPGGQVMIYEMGETFGGYWGPLPVSALEHETKTKANFYTLKTSQPTAETNEITTDTETETTDAKTTVTAADSISKESGDFVEVEVPLVELSAKLVPGPLSPTEGIDKEAFFDLNYDVTPIPGIKYESSMLPVVQFSPRKEQGFWRKGGVEEPRYELDIVEPFTPDSRLTLPQLSHTSFDAKKFKNQRLEANRRLNFKKSKTPVMAKSYFDRYTILPFAERIEDTTQYVFPTPNMKTSGMYKKYTSDTWQAIETLMKKLSETKKNIEDQGGPNEMDAVFLEKNSNMDQNFSLYLMPNLSIYNNINARKEQYNEIKNSNNIKFWLPTKLSYTPKTRSLGYSITSYNETVTKVNGPSDSQTLDIAKHINNSVKENVQINETNHITIYQTAKTDTILKSKIYNRNASSISTKSYTVENMSGPVSNVAGTNTTQVAANITNLKLVTGSLVNHESWENVVQAAPVMAVLLNHTVPFRRDNNKTSESVSTTLDHTNNTRKKRTIHAISVENARPRIMTTKMSMATTTRTSYDIAEMQEFAQLVELQDDELHGRVALRNLQQYLGSSLLNLCSINDGRIRQVYLFNSSRIVIAINNFTIDHLTIILTAARTLLNGENKCPNTQLECQISGARVCLDSMVACDGVPNCGSDDIYDEDRLMCGKSEGLQHNVYLAAMTLLAVLLTALYAVHYWLKRYVPRVADAFFVYIEGVENILYLDTVMRSPNDVDNMSKMFYHGNLFGDDLYIETQKEHKNFSIRFLKFCCFCCFGNTNKNVPEKELEEHEEIGTKRLFSFTQLELRKIVNKSQDVSVQTGDSLELNNMHYLRTTTNVSPSKNHGNVADILKPIQSPIMNNESLFTLEGPLPEENVQELSLLNFFRKTRLDSSKFGDKSSKSELSSEEEIITYAYDDRLTKNDSFSQTTAGDEKFLQSRLMHVRKHLRFDNVTTAIPAVEYDDENEDDNDTISHIRESTNGNERHTRNRNLDTIEEDGQHSSGTTRERLHFWDIKAKKAKKKKHVALR